MRGRLWTNAELEALRVLFGAMPIDRAAATLGRSVPACWAQARRLGLSKPWVAIDDLELARLHALGLSSPEIARRFGVSAPTIVKRLKRSGLPLLGHYSRRFRDKSKTNLARTCNQMGVKNFAELRWLTHRLRAARTNKGGLT